MELIKQSFEVLTHVDRYQYHRDIEDAARSCYQSSHKNPEKDPLVTTKFVEKMVKSGHLSTIEHKSISVRFITNRGVTHELVRHRLASYSQESTRYCSYAGKEMQFILPVWMDNNHLGAHTEAYQDPFDTVSEYVFIDSLLRNEVDYGILLNDCGQSPQQAREVLPNALKTDIVVTANLRQWLTILQQRTAKAAHLQIRHLMCGLLLKFNDLLPSIFNPDTVPQACGDTLNQVNEEEYYGPAFNI